MAALLLPQTKGVGQLILNYPIIQFLVLLASQVAIYSYVAQQHCTMHCIHVWGLIRCSYSLDVVSIPDYKDVGQLNI